MKQKPNSTSLYEQVKQAKPLFYPGKVLTEKDVRVIEELFKRVRSFDAEFRDLLEELGAQPKEAESGKEA